MASASSSSARHLFSDSKRRLAERVNVNVNNAASVARQIVRSSKSNEILMQSARNFALQETTIENSLQNLRKVQSLLRENLDCQLEVIENNGKKLEYVNEQMRAMER